MKVAVIRFPGSNCDDDAKYAFQTVCEASVRLVWHRDEPLGNPDLVVIPGGFSYGDYLRSGALAAKSPIMEEVKRFAEGGGLVLGICNGFQILTEAGLLPGQLAHNPQLHFVCEEVTVRVERTGTAFSSLCLSGQVLGLPIAHNEGSYYADDETLARLEGEGRVLFRYCDASGKLAEESNPNGSLNHIAGILNEGGNVLGMMPHPERTAEALLGSADGAIIFRSLLASSRLLS